MTLERLQVIIEAYTKPYRDELEKVKAKTSEATRHVERQTSKIKKSYGGIAGSLKGILGALGIGAIVMFGKSCIQLGSDLAEVQNVVDVTFGDMSRQVNAFSQNAIAKFGLSELTAKKYMGTYGAMAKAFGFNTEQTYAMSAAITGLTGDVASFYNLSTDEAFTKLKAIFSGETEVLKDLGIVMTQTALDQYALNNGLGKTTAKMTEQEKVMLRYQFVMAQLSDASGDFIRTSDGWANQTRVLALQFESLKATIGQGLINVLTPVIQVINTILAKLQTLANYFKAFTQALFGHAGGKSNPISDAAGSMSKAAGTSGAVANNMGKAAGAAKKLKEYTLGIDELNVINPDSDDGGGSGGGGGGDTPDFGDMSGELFGEVTVNPEIEAAVQRMKDIIEALQKAADPTKEALKRLWDEGLAKLGTFAWDSLSDFYNDFLIPIGDWALGEGLPRFLDIVNSFLMTVNWEQIRSALDNFWKALEPFAENVGDGLLNFYDDLSKFGADFINFVVPGGINKLADSLGKIKADEAEDIGYALGVISVSLIGLKIAGGVAVGVTALGKAIKSFPGVKGLLELFSVGWASASMIGLPGFFEGLSAALMIGAKAFGGAGTPAFDVIGGKIIDGIDLFIRINFGEKVLNALGEGLLIGISGGAGFLMGGPIGALAGLIIGAILDAIQGGGLANKFWTQIKQDLFNFDTAAGFFDDMKQCFKNAFKAESFAEIGVNIVEGVISGMLAIVAFAMEPITDLFDIIVKGICDLFGINSPAKAMEPYGGYILLGIIEGFKNTFENWTTALSEWFDYYITPWFTEQKWSELYDTIKTELGATWDGTVVQWATDITDWWNIHVAPWFTIEKWLGLYDGIKSSMKTKWDETVLVWGTDIRSWWDTQVAPWFTLEKWAGIMKSVPDAFRDIFRSAVNSAVGQLNKLIDWINLNLHFSFDGLEIMGEEVIPSFDVQLFTIPHIPEFADGGLISSGQLFVANEAGPELVGRYGSKTGVMNNHQIVDAVSEGVAIAVSNVLTRSQSEEDKQNIEVNLMVDGRTLTKVVTDTHRRSGYRLRLT